jgi:hypothetical protein
VSAYCFHSGYAPAAYSQVLRNHNLSALGQTLRAANGYLYWLAQDTDPKTQSPLWFMSRLHLAEFQTQSDFPRLLLPGPYSPNTGRFGMVLNRAGNIAFIYPLVDLDWDYKHIPLRRTTILVCRVL